MIAACLQVQWFTKEAAFSHTTLRRPSRVNNGRFWPSLRVSAGAPKADHSSEHANRLFCADTVEKVRIGGKR